MGTCGVNCVCEFVCMNGRTSEWERMSTASLSLTPWTTICGYYICASSTVWGVTLRWDYSLLCLHYRTESQLKRKITSQQMRDRHQSIDELCISLSMTLKCNKCKVVCPKMSYFASYWGWQVKTDFRLKIWILFSLKSQRLHHSQV